MRRMKSTISFDMFALEEFSERGGLDIAYIRNRKNSKERLIILETCICFIDVKRRHGVAEIDWEEFGNAILLSKYQPVLECAGGFFTFKIESPLSEYADGRSMIYGHMSPLTKLAFAKIPFINLPRQFESVAA